MNQLINWLRQRWIKLTYSVSTTNKSIRLQENQLDNSSQEGVQRSPNKVYYSIPGGRTRWAYINKGRITGPNTTFVKVKTRVN